MFEIIITIGKTVKHSRF